MNTFTEENYLKTLFILSGKSEQVTVNQLSSQLHIKMPTVTSMMKKLSEKKLVHYQRYKPLRLTERGKKAASIIIRKHRLTEMFLVQKMGIGWETVHAIAEQIEHIQSTEFFEKMDELLGYPKLDPHGSPIPDKHGKMERKTLKHLSECKAGSSVKLAAVNNTSVEFLKFLNSRDLKLGTRMKIRSVEPFDRTMVVSYGRHVSETLSLVVSSSLLVEN